MRILSFKMFIWFMESKVWSGFGYFTPDLEKIKQLLVCSKHQNTWEDTGNVVKVFFSIQSKKKNVRQWKETKFSTSFVVKSATSLLLNSLKFTWQTLTFFCRETRGFCNFETTFDESWNWSLSLLANYASWSREQIKCWRNLTVLKY